jgi:hypothetical protein
MLIHHALDPLPLRLVPGWLTRLAMLGRSSNRRDLRAAVPETAGMDEVQFLRQRLWRSDEGELRLLQQLRAV